jgi:DNA-binding PadR family transcriptional regulator
MEMANRRRKKVHRNQEEEIPTLSGKERLILDMLIAGGEMYGLEVVDRSEGRVKRGTVYTTLERMHEKGYVTFRKVDPPSGGGGMPRRLYKVTGDGIKVHRALTVKTRKGRIGWVGDLVPG